MNEQTWQPIETAPRDGTKIVCAEYINGRDWLFWPDYWRKYLGDFGEGFGRPAFPTHWMPLPEPPTQPRQQTVEPTNEKERE